MDVGTQEAIDNKQKLYGGGPPGKCFSEKDACYERVSCREYYPLQPASDPETKTDDFYESCSVDPITNKKTGSVLSRTRSYFKNKGHTASMPGCFVWAPKKGGCGSTNRKDCQACLSRRCSNP